jgi:hypothetical protein
MRLRREVKELRRANEELVVEIHRGGRDYSVTRNFLGSDWHRDAADSPRSVANAAHAPGDESTHGNY